VRRIPSGARCQLAFQRGDGASFMLSIASLQRVRALLEELAMPAEAIEVVCGIGEDRAALLAQVRGETPILLFPLILPGCELPFPVESPERTAAGTFWVRKAV